MSEAAADHVVINLMSLQNKIQKRIGGALSVHGLGLSDYFVLNQLYMVPARKMRRSDLAERVGLTPSGITRLLNPLEKIGLVVKESNSRDARVSLVALSLTGKQVFEDAKVSFSESCRVLFDPLDSSQIDELDGLVKALL